MPYIRVEDSGEVVSLTGEVTTVGRGQGVDVRLNDPSVSRLHAEIVRRGPYIYVVDLGLSRNGTRVNGRPVARRVLEDGDVVAFGAARCRVGGLPREDLPAEAELRRPAVPDLTRRELDVLASLCRPALSDDAFVAPATAREIAADLVVTEAAVKQHLLRLYQKFRISGGLNRRIRLANEVVALGLVRPADQPAAAGYVPEARLPADHRGHRPLGDLTGQPSREGPTPKCGSVKCGRCSRMLTFGRCGSMKPRLGQYSGGFAAAAATAAAARQNMTSVTTADDALVRATARNTRFISRRGPAEPGPIP